VLPVAALFALLGAVVAGGALRATCLAFAGLSVAAAVYQARSRPCLLVDEHGYAVVEHRREKLRVAWSEARRILADVEEHALYVDVGDPARNLLVPPARGFGFRFERAPELFARIVAARPDIVKQVARLTGPPEAPAAPEAGA
jgi:hypothetical protein